MDEQLKIQNQQQIVTEKRNEEQNRVALIPKESFLNTEKEMAGKKQLTRTEILELKKQNAISLDEKLTDTINQGKNELLYEPPEAYSMDQAKDYLLHLPEIDLTTDEAVIRNYPLFAKMEAEFVKLSAYEKAFMDGKSLDPIFKVLYNALRYTIAYGKARMDVISDPLYQQMTEDEVKALREKTENITPEEKALRKKLNTCTTAEKVFRFATTQEEEEGFLSIRIRVPENSAYAPKEEEIKNMNNELVDFLDEEVFEKQLEFSEDEIEFAKEDFADEEIADLKEDMEMPPEEILALQQEQNPVEKTFSAEEKQKEAEKILKNRDLERRKEELSRVEDVQDHYSLLQDSRYSDLTDSDEMTQVKMSLFSLQLAVKGQQLDSEELPIFRQYQAQCYGEKKVVVIEDDYITTASFTAEQVEEKFETAIRNCQTYIDSHGGFTFKAITKTGRDRLRLVREAQERARKELRLFREMKEQGRLDLDDGAVKNADEVYAVIHQRLDAEERLLPAVKKYISNGKRRARDMAVVFSAFTVLEKEDPYRFGGLLSGEDSMTKQLLKDFASYKFFKEMGQLEAELLSSLKAQYDLFFAAPVPASYLKEGQDPFDPELRKQYALHRVSADGDYTKLRAMDRLHDFLTEGQRKNIDKAFQDTGGGKTEEMRSLCSAGGILYQELKAMDDAGSIAPDLFSGMVTYDRESYANQLKKGIADLITPYEANQETKDAFDLNMDTEYADYVEKQVDGEFVEDTEAEEKQRVSQRAYVVNQKAHLAKRMREQTDMLFLVQNTEEMNERFLLRTDPDYVEKLLKSENTDGHVKMVRAAEKKENEVFQELSRESSNKAMRYYMMSNHLGMDGVVRKVRRTYNAGMAQKESGIFLEKHTGVSLHDLTHKDEYKVNGEFVTKMSEKAEADLAKIAILDILCGRPIATPEQLFCKVDQEKGIITDVYAGEQLHQSFGEMSGKEAMRQLMRSAPQAIAKLDENTRKRILSMGPVTLATSFGTSLKRREMDALQDRLRALQDRIRKVEKDSVRLKNDMVGQVMKDEKTLSINERFDMDLTEKNALQDRIDLKLQILGSDATPELKKVLKERLQKEENALHKVYRLSLCFQRMNRVQQLNEVKDPAVAMLLENLKKDVETARRHYNTAATKEVEKLERIMRPEDLEAYIR